MGKRNGKIISLTYKIQRNQKPGHVSSKKTLSGYSKWMHIGIHNSVNEIPIKYIKFVCF